MTDVTRILGVLALVACATGSVLMAVVCLPGSPAAVPAVTPGPPAGGPDGVTVTALLWAAIVIGGLGVGLGLVALARGWRPRPWALYAGGLVAAVVLTVAPVGGSTDALDYAIYGRIAALGHDPWVMTPGQLLHLGDPVGLLAPPTWRHVAAAYGPVAIGLFRLASYAGGTSMALTVSVIKVLSGLAFLLTGLLLDRTAGPDGARRARVHLLWTCNPLMLWSAVAGAHVDVVGAALTAAAILALRRPGVARGAAAGALMGTAIAVKAPFALIALGLLWAARRSPKALAAGLATGACVLGTAYLLAGGSAVAAVAAKQAAVSMINPWKPIGALFHASAKAATGYEVTGIVTGLALAAVAWWSLSRRTGADPALVPAFALTLGWLLTSSLQHPWYDAMLVPMLALLPGSRLDALLVTRLTVSCLAYVPGMPGVPLPSPWQYLVHVLYDSWLAPCLLDAAIVTAVLTLALRSAPKTERAGRLTPARTLTH